MSRVRSDMMSFRCDDEGRLRAAAEGAPAAFGEVRGKSAERPVDPAVYLEDGDLQHNAEHHGGGDLRVLVRDLAARDGRLDDALQHGHRRSEEHTSELQSLMRISYAVFCLKKKNTYTH